MYTRQREKVYIRYVYSHYSLDIYKVHIGNTKVDIVNSITALGTNLLAILRSTFFYFLALQTKAGKKLRSGRDGLKQQGQQRCDSVNPC